MFALAIQSCHTCGDNYQHDNASISSTDANVSVPRPRRVALLINRAPGCIYLQHTQITISNFSAERTKCTVGTVGHIYVSLKSTPSPWMMAPFAIYVVATRRMGLRNFPAAKPARDAQHVIRNNNVRAGDADEATVGECECCIGGLAEPTAFYRCQHHVSHPYKDTNVHPQSGEQVADRRSDEPTSRHAIMRRRWVRVELCSGNHRQQQHADREPTNGGGVV